MYSPRTAALPAAATLAAMMIAASGCSSGEVTSSGPATSSTATSATTPTTSPAPSPSSSVFHIGQTVTLTGTVTDDLVPFSFQLQPDSRADTIAVISVRDSTINKGDHVTVQGRIATFDTQAIENDLHVTLDRSFVDEYSGKQVLLAQGITEK